MLGIAFAIGIVHTFIRHLSYRPTYPRTHHHAKNQEQLLSWSISIKIFVTIKILRIKSPNQKLIFLVASVYFFTLIYPRGGGEWSEFELVLGSNNHSKFSKSYRIISRHPVYSAKYPHTCPCWVFNSVLQTSNGVVNAAAKPPAMAPDIICAAGL